MSGEMAEVSTPQEVPAAMLMRFDPFRELDRASQQAFQSRPPAVPMDAYRLGDTFLVHLDLPGVDPDGVEVTVEKNVLTITAERQRPRREGVELLVGERPHGRFTRQLFLGDGLDTDRIEARYDAGVLTVSVPVAEASKPRRVDVSVGESNDRSIEATSTPSPGLEEREPASVN